MIRPLHNHWVNWYTLYGLEGLESEPRSRKPVLPFVQIAGLLRLLVQLSPQELGYQRSRWSTELMALELKRNWQLSLHASTIRRWLPRLGIVWCELDASRKAEESGDAGPKSQALHHRHPACWNR